MNCPACKYPMVALELEEVEIDHCLKCGGIWLDAGELGLLLEEAQERDELLSKIILYPSSKEKVLKCPICRKRMAKYFCDIEPKTYLDACRYNHGFWFDKGELKTVIASCSSMQKSQVVTLLKKMFGK
jgi:Zn-finger nucleic acid-binding protein